MQSIDLNCDMGESTTLWPYSTDHDIDLLDYVSSANIACGFHAGDAYTMHELVEAALKKNVAVGAHPGFEDRADFGRKEIQLAPGKIYDLVIYQLGALDALLSINGTRLRHVKPHGALYNMAAKNEIIAMAICSAVKDYNPALLLYGLSGSELIRCAALEGLTCSSEVFADRTYQDDGSLTPRSQGNALIADEDACIQQVLQMIEQRTVTAVSGKTVAVTADTVCIHGDGANARAFAKRIYQSLKQKGIAITSP